jgi:hypothetical protein
MKKISLLVVNFAASIGATDFAINADQYMQIKQMYEWDYQNCKNTQCTSSLYTAEPDEYMKEYLADDDARYRAINAITEVLISKEFKQWKQEQTEKNKEKLDDRIAFIFHAHVRAVLDEIPAFADNTVKDKAIQTVYFFENNFKAFKEQFIFGTNQQGIV